MEKTILLVDDNDFHRQLYRELLEEEGYTVELSPDGDNAVIKVRLNRPDLIVLDLEMPNRDGIETIRTLLKNFPDLCIVIHSAHSHYKNDFIAWGARAYVVKSSNPALLLTEVNKVAGSARTVA